MDNKNNVTDILIVGAGPVGMFTVFEAGLLGLKCTLLDILPQAGGQCTQLYADKPIYDIPGVPMQTAAEHIQALEQQIAPFKPSFHYQQRVETIRELSESEIKTQNLEVNDFSWFEVSTNNGLKFVTKNVFIASGGGAFEPRKPDLELDAYEGCGVNYHVQQIADYSGQKVIIFGGGDSALDWAVELAKVADVSLVHRRDVFRGAPNTEQKMRELVAQEKVKLYVPYTLESVAGDGRVESCTLNNFKTGEKVKLEADKLLFLLGLSKHLGPLLSWGLKIEKNKIIVDTEKFETSTPGIFAVGDINTYPGKLDLILCGFHETTLAVQHAYRRINPTNRVPFRYTTSDPKLEKLINE